MTSLFCFASTGCRSVDEGAVVLIAVAVVLIAVGEAAAASSSEKTSAIASSATEPLDECFLRTGAAC